MDSVKVIIIALMLNLVIGMALLAQNNTGQDIWFQYFADQDTNTQILHGNVTMNTSNAQAQLTGSPGQQTILDPVGAFLIGISWVIKLFAMYFGLMLTFMIPGVPGESLTLIEVVGRMMIGIIWMINNFVMFLEIYKILMNKKSW